jgi:hypothetical protein
MSREPNSRKTRLRLFAVPAAIFVVALIFETVLFNLATQGFSPVAGDVGHVTLSEPDKKLIEIQTSYSTWLQGIATAVLGAVVALRLKDPHNERLLDRPALIACSLLLVSLYSAHLVQTGIMFALAHGPLSMIYSGLITIPLACQFWSLIGGIGVFAFWLLRPYAFRSKLLPIALFVTCSAAFAQQQPRYSSCVLEWQKASGLKADPAGADAASAVLARLASRAGIEPGIADRCAYTAGVMDQIRLQSISLSNPDTPEALDNYVQRLSDELGGPGFGANDFLQGLVALLMPWTGPSGRIHITSTQGYKTIRIDSKPAGFRNVDWRYPPGQHTIEVTEAYKVVLSRTVTLASGDYIEIDLDKETPRSKEGK